MSPETKDGSAGPAGGATAFYSRFVECLTRGERVALGTILRLAGSGPRRAGAKILVCEAGESFGTVGGGVLEAKVTGWAREALRLGRPLCRPFALDLQQASDDGMTCGGEVEVLVEPFVGSLPTVRDLFALVVSALARRERCWLVTTIASDGDNIETEHGLVTGEGLVGGQSDSGRGLPEDILRVSSPTAPTLLERGAVRYFVDPLTPPITVYVFGGGHIGRHLVPLCHLLGFRTVVVDDRADFVTPARFPQADERIAVTSFEGAPGHFPMGADSYVVIVTRGHGGDQALLRQALAHRPGYIGMIGSSRKRGLIFTQLLAEGITQEDLARVACPVGLPIGAETPEEIAVSIAAQLVAVRAADRGEG